MTALGSVKIVLEGERAEAATRDLFSKGWFEAEWERKVSDGAPDSVPASIPPASASPSSVVRAQVVAIAGGSVTIADKILGWWQGWSSEDGNGADLAPLSVVLEASSGARVPLAGADRDSLVEVLRVLQTPGR
jgi:hypothetical protein